MKHSPVPTEDSSNPPIRIAVREGRRVHFLSPAEIDWVASDGNYLDLHVGSQTLTHRETLGSFLDRLPAAMFAKVHRSVIVNLDRIKELRAIERGEYEIVLEDGQALETNLPLRRLKELIESA